MDNLTMFETLLELPLLKGVSKERITDILGKVKFHFLKYPPKTEIVRPEEPCTHLKFILSGSVRVSISTPDNRFSISQTLSAPDVIMPDFLFGRATLYPCTVEAQTTVSIMQIEKSDYLKILQTDEVFMLNYLNYLSMNAQKNMGLLALTSGSIENRIAYWIVSLTQPTGTDIVLQCRHRDLYTVFGMQRSTFMGALDNMRASGLIDYTADQIRILNRRSLLDLIFTHPD